MRGSVVGGKAVMLIRCVKYQNASSMSLWKQHDKGILSVKTWMMVGQADSLRYLRFWGTTFHQKSMSVGPSVPTTYHSYSAQYHSQVTSLRALGCSKGFVDFREGRKNKSMTNG